MLVPAENCWGGPNHRGGLAPARPPGSASVVMAQHSRRHIDLHDLRQQHYYATYETKHIWDSRIRKIKSYEHIIRIYASFMHYSIYYSDTMYKETMWHLNVRMFLYILNFIVL
jgi:hypothetical protein